MKRIVICCDGTWNRFDAPNPTNVVKLFNNVLDANTRPRASQSKKHFDGVGVTGRGFTAIARKLDRVIGGAFGVGLDEQILLAYRFLVEEYHPGDHIFIFGYSRGAYSARSLTGLIRNAGILERAHQDQADAAMALYRSSEEPDAPDGERALAFRAKFAGHVVTGDWEPKWRARHGFDGRNKPLAGVRYLGIWDTVGALGIPTELNLGGIFNRDYEFHDTKLSSTVWSARHAVAIDERRASFRPTLWMNLCALEAGAPGRYREQWFPGEHGSVGGGGDEDRAGLANAALLWIAEGASEAGLKMDARWQAGLAKLADACGSLSCVKDPSLTPVRVLTRLRLIDRDGPEHLEQVSDTTLTRWHEPTLAYRPVPLAKLGTELDALPWPPPAPAPAAAAAPKPRRTKAGTALSRARTPKSAVAKTRMPMADGPEDRPRFP